jgi:DNA-binding CsgD family transcriptional regulator
MTTAAAPGGDERPSDPLKLAPRIRDRLHRVRELRVSGHTRAQIARDLDVTERTISNDLARIDQLRALEFASHIDTNGRLHSRDVYTAVQAAAWDAVHTILSAPSGHRDQPAPADAPDSAPDSDRYRNLAPLLRIVNESQRAIDALPPLSGRTAAGVAGAADLVNLIASAMPAPPTAT